MKLARHRIASLIVIVLAGLVAALPAQHAAAGAEPILTSDLLRIRQVTAIDVSRDGTRAVYCVKSIAELPAERPPDSAPPPPAATSPATAPATQPAPMRVDGHAPSGRDAPAQPTWKYQSHLFLLDLTSPNAQPRQITFGDRFDSSPRFAPDGRRIAFVRAASSTRGSGHGRHASAAEPQQRSQTWIMPIDGGEAWQATDFADGCDRPLWSPDGGRLLVSAEARFSELEGQPAWPSERPKRGWNDAALPHGAAAAPDGSREQIRAWLEHNGREDNPIVINRLDFQDELHLRGEMTFTQLYVLDVPSSAMGASPITRDRARRITSGFFDHVQSEFMPDGQSVVYVSKKPTDRHPDRVLGSDIWRVNVDGTNDRRILALEGWALFSPKPSRDGAVIAFLGNQMDQPAFRQTQLGMAPIKGDTAADPVWLTDEATFMSSVDAFEWLPMQPGLMFTAAMRGGFPLMTISPGLLQPATLVGEEDGRPVGVQAFAAGGGVTVYSVASAANPCMLKVRDARTDRLAHDLNEWVKDKAISLPSANEITRPDGTKVQMWLMEPTAREAGRKYPLCLEMHGGPMAMWGPGEFTMWHEFQLLCSWGYGVVYANPRGSSGYGYAFQRGNYQDWGEGPAGDVLAAVDHALNKDWVDQERLVITGGSYAGYLTAWIVAHDHRFKAAVAQRGVYDIETFFGEGNAWRLVQWCFGGNPYEARVKEVIARNSPFTHVAKIRTPLLIMHASNDLRTGVSQSEMMYRALKELNKPVEYVRYPNAGHDLSRAGDPRQRMDRLNRIIEFFERHIENPRGMSAVGQPAGRITSVMHANAAAPQPGSRACRARA